MTLKLEFTVAAIAERDRRFLVVQERAARRIVFNQPAGHVEDGESVVQAVVRETLEETGRRFEPEGVVGLYVWRESAGRTVVRVAFCGDIGERDESLALDRAIIRCDWLGRDELAARNGELRSPLVLRCIDDYLKGARFPLALLNQLPPA